MRKFIRLECDICNHQFQYLSDGDHDMVPEECPACGEASSDQTVTQLPNFINLKGWRTKSKDETYRNFERNSERQIEIAAEQTGGDKADFAHLKITDMRSDVREGEFALKTPPVNNAVTQRMDEMKQRGQQVGFVNPQGGSVPQGTGVNPFVDAAMGGIKNGHAQKAAAIPRASQLGSYTPK